MARFRCTQAFHFGSRRVPAGGTMADSVANAVGNDAVWTGMSSATLPPGCVALDGAATSMLAASKWAGVPVSATITGVDSISA